MGCCPSKSRAQRDAHYDASCSELVESSAVQATTTTAFVDSSSIVNSTSPSSSNQQSDGATSTTLLMDCGDGTLLLKSDSDPTPSSPPSALEPLRSFSNDNDGSGNGSAGGPDESTTSTAKSAVNGAVSSNDGDDNNNTKRHSVVNPSAISGIRTAEPTEPTEPTSSVGASETPTPLALQSSPRKAPVNFDDVPITSMYHRIHVAEAEALDARRQAELQAEAARRELEVREFKAAMQRAP